MDSHLRLSILQILLFICLNRYDMLGLLMCSPPYYSKGT